MSFSPPDYSAVLWDSSGKPYWKTQDGGKLYIAPLTASSYQTDPKLQAWARSMGVTLKPGSMIPETTGRPEGNFFQNAGTWNSGEGDWDQGANWGNIAALAAGGLIAAPFVAGALGAGAGGVGVGETGATVGLTSGAGLPGAVAAPSVAGALGAAPAAGVGVSGVGGGAPTLALAPGAQTVGPSVWSQVARSALGVPGGGGGGMGAWDWVGPAINAGTQIAGASMQANAAKDNASLQVQASEHAADLQAKAAADALAFQKQQAAYDAMVAETNRSANYGQWAAKAQQLGSVGEALGLPSRSIPGYVPLPQNPYGTAPGQAVTPNVSPGMAQPQGAPASVANGDYQGYFNGLTGGKPLDQKGLEALGPQLQAAGIQLGNPNASGIRSKIILPDGTAVRVLNGDTSIASQTGWTVQPGTGGSAQRTTQPVTAPIGVGSVADFLKPYTTTGNLSLPTYQYQPQ